MKRAEFLNRLDAMLELEPGTLEGGEELSELESWDSLAVMSFIAFVFSEFDLRLSGQSIRECKTTNDLVSLLGDRIHN